MKVLALNSKGTHEKNPECPQRLIPTPNGRDWMCLDCGAYILQEYVEVDRTDPDVPIAISLSDLASLEQLRKTYVEHGRATIKVEHPLKFLQIDLLSGEGYLALKPVEVPRTKVFEMNTVEELKKLLEEERPKLDAELEEINKPQTGHDCESFVPLEIEGRSDAKRWHPREKTCDGTGWYQCKKCVLFNEHREKELQNKMSISCETQQTISDLLGDRPIRWAKIGINLNDHRWALEVFNTDAAEQLPLLRKIRRVDTSFVVIFHTRTETARLYSDFVQKWNDARRWVDQEVKMGESKPHRREITNESE